MKPNTQNRFCIKQLLAASSFFAMSMGAHAGTKTWLGTTTTWDTGGAANWAGPTTWAAGDDAIFNTTGAGIVQVTAGGVFAHSLTFNNNGYTIQGGTLTLNGGTNAITVGTGISTAISSVIAGSTFVKADAGTLSLTKTGVNQLASGVGTSWTVAGTINANTAATTHTMAAAVNLNGGTLGGTSAGFSSTLGTWHLNNGGCLLTATGSNNFISSTNLSLSAGNTLTFATTAVSDTLSVSANIFTGTATSVISKTGLGTVTLSGQNTYTGTTSITGGTLLINGNSSAATGNLTAAANTTIGGTGSIGAAVTTVNGTLQGGAGAVGQTLTLTGVVTFANNSIIQLALDDGLTHSTLALNGTETFDPTGANQAFSFLDFGATTGTYQNILTGITADPGMTAWTITNGGWVGNFIYDDANDAIDFNLTAVPEPAAAMLGSLGLLALLRRRRA